jgi:hypothetical protein
MKKIMLLILASVAAHAGTTTLNCVVPQENTPVITAVIEASEDFMTLTINQPEGQLLYFNQLDKGAFKEGIAGGSLVTLVLSETAKMINGSIKGAGFLVLQKDGAAFSGFASLNDTFYPLNCK